MARRTRPEKPYVYVFCEGESEQAYAGFLKKQFKHVAVLEIPSKPGLFEEAAQKFKKESKFINNAEIIDEIWFFYDVETKDIDKWDSRLKIIKQLRKLRKNPNIRVRLLMTSGCIEYWLLLHFKLLAPSVRTTAEKEKVIAQLKNIEKTYEKGNVAATEKIARNYPIAVKNAAQILRNLLSDGLPCMEDTDERNQWLSKNCKTFSNVYEAIDYLELLENKRQNKL